MTFTVAIIGRPNVGKSTLFNRLTGKRLAIVDDTPGVTRDRREGQGSIADISFTLFDTAGLEDSFDDSLEARMRHQTERGLEMADVALMMIDSRAGITPLDAHFAKWIRKQKTPVILVANKCEGKAGLPGLHESYSLGLGEPLAISSEHGEGMGDLYDALRPYADAAEAEAKARDEDDLDLDIDPRVSIDIDPDAEPEDVEENRILQMAIVGRPNVGKSTLVNRLFGDERMLTGPEAGITRDAIALPWQYEGREIRLVDTAGLRRRAKITKKLENMSAGDSLRAIKYAHVVVLVLDADAVLEKQDLNIARHVIEEGRALMIVINKWDVASSRKESLQRLNDKLQTSLPQVRGITVVQLSAKTGKGVEKLMPAVLELHDMWNRRIPTGEMNRWLEQITEYHPPPLTSGRRIRLRYMTQVKTRPPTFVIFISKPTNLPDSYLRYLVNAMREDFDLPGIPLRILPRKGKNPYADD